MGQQTWKDADILCPFYKHQHREKRTISCEGVLRKTRTTSSHSFQRQAEFDDHLARFCAARYRECPFFQAIMRVKYGD